MCAKINIAESYSKSIINRVAPGGWTRLFHFQLLLLVKVFLRISIELMNWCNRSFKKDFKIYVSKISNIFSINFYWIHYLVSVIKISWKKVVLLKHCHKYIRFFHWLKKYIFLSGLIQSWYSILVNFVMQLEM